MTEQYEAIIELARAVYKVADAIRDLGNGNAATNMGAIEALGVSIQDGLRSIAVAIEDKR